MPVGVVKTKQDEHLWETAKNSIRKQFPGLEKSNPTKFWTRVNGLFQKIKRMKNGK